MGEYMKALVIASVLFFSLRAMSEEGSVPTDCTKSDQTSKREMKSQTEEVIASIVKSSAEAVSK